MFIVSFVIKGIQLGMDISEILKGDLEIFEVSGTPIKGIPRKARENTQKQVKLIANTLCRKIK